MCRDLGFPCLCVLCCGGRSSCRGLDDGLPVAKGGPESPSGVEQLRQIRVRNNFQQRPPNALDCRDHYLSLEPLHFLDRKSTRLNSSHLVISYAVFCLKTDRGTICC